MAFKATNKLPSAAYQQAKNEAISLRQFALDTVNRLDADVTGKQIVDASGIMSSFKESFVSLRAVPGIGAYASDQEDTPTYDVSAEFLAMESALDAAIAIITANNTNILISGWSASGRVIWATFTPAQTATLKTAMQAVADSIE